MNWRSSNENHGAEEDAPTASVGAKEGVKGTAVGVDRYEIETENIFHVQSF